MLSERKNVFTKCKTFIFSVDKTEKRVYNIYRKKARPQTVMPKELILR